MDNQPYSEFGEGVLELTRLSPTLYPILFAAITSRFYKTLARWCLERPSGTRLAVLEQIFGSQSFAAAFERLFLFRTQAAVGFVILLTWAMSPLGGQSASRVLYNGTASFTSNGTIYYADPAYQISYYSREVSTTGIADMARIGAEPGVDVLYSTSLLSSRQQKRSPRDLWGLPKIPQWPRHKTGNGLYNVSNLDLEYGQEYYSSLLGIKIQGLANTNIRTYFDFSVQTSYLDINCDFVDTFNPLIDDLSKNQSAFYAHFNSLRTLSSFVVIGESDFADYNQGFKPPYRFSYVKQVRGSDLYIVNCSLQEISVETTIRCGPGNPETSCLARQQRRLDSPSSAARLPSAVSASTLGTMLSSWAAISNEDSGYIASPTELYIMKDSNPYSGETVKPWTESDLSVFPSVFSRRMTAAFNTFWGSTLNPHGHTNITFGVTPEQNILSPAEGEPTGQLFMNTTIGTRTISLEVYRVNRLWVGILLFATMLLQILAISGLVLQAFILGPDVLGFASTMTRDNPYVPLPPGGSHLDGRDRAKRLRDVRLELTDVRPEDDNGYIAVRAVPWAAVREDAEDGDEKDNKPVIPGRLNRKRLYN